MFAVYRVEIEARQNCLLPKPYIAICYLLLQAGEMATKGGKVILCILCRQINAQEGSGMDCSKIGPHVTLGIKRRTGIKRNENDISFDRRNSSCISEFPAFAPFLRIDSMTDRAPANLPNRYAQIPNRNIIIVKRIMFSANKYRTNK